MTAREILNKVGAEIGEEQVIPASEPTTRTISFEIPADAFKPGDVVESSYHGKGEWVGVVMGYWFYPLGYYPRNERGDGSAWGYIALRDDGDDPEVFAPYYLRRLNLED